MRYVRAFGRFWWDFIVGDDWVVAAAIGLVSTGWSPRMSTRSIWDSISGSRLRGR